MRTENLLNRRILGFRSPRGLYRWLRTVLNGLLHGGGVSISDRLWCLSHGFAPSVLKLYGREEVKKNYKSYLSDKQYFSIHPVNGDYSFWIDDKMTMKYVFSKYNDYLPAYYFQTENDKILRLGDCPRKYASTVEGIVECLDDVAVIAAKRIYGSCGVGFYKLEKKAGDYYVTGKKTSKEELLSLLKSLKGYLFQEYIVNHKVIRNIWPDATNTMRMLIANMDNEYILMRSFIRFGNAKSNGVDNAHAGGIEAIIDEYTGKIIKTLQQDAKGALTPITEHPDSHQSFAIEIPNWDIVNNVLKDICDDFPQLRYMGFDVAITDKGFKILEINSLSGIMAAQAKEPLLGDPKTRAVYERFGLKL